MVCWYGCFCGGGVRFIVRETVDLIEQFSSSVQGCSLNQEAAVALSCGVSGSVKVQSGNHCLRDRIRVDYEFYVHVAL